MIRIVGWVPSASYAPELFALSDYLNAKSNTSFTVASSCDKVIDLEEFDLSYMKMGFAPIWNRSSLPEIHDYASAASGQFAALKHLVKKRFSRKPVLRSFLSSYVEARFGFRDGVPRVTRDMGVPDSFVISESRNLDQVEFDLFYAGSITSSRDTGAMLFSICESRRRVLVVGTPSDEIYHDFKNSSHVEFAGKVQHHEIPTHASRCFAGINHTPDVEPLNRQTSTKVLEYLAMGLPVVSNKYEWVHQFEATSGARLLKYGDFNRAMELLYDFDYVIPDMTPYRWSDIFEQSGIYEAILSAYRKTT